MAIVQRVGAAIRRFFGFKPAARGPATVRGPMPTAPAGLRQSRGTRLTRAGMMGIQSKTNAPAVTGKAGADHG